jgi:hypothetical protein
VRKGRRSPRPGEGRAPVTDQLPTSLPLYWMYVGPGPGRGAIHKLLNADESEFITWTVEGISAPGEGWTFLGSRKLFLQHFRPA